MAAADYIAGADWRLGVNVLPWNQYAHPKAKVPSRCTPFHGGRKLEDAERPGAGSVEQNKSAE